ncbi:MAG: alpha/beta hydrolase [Syntrophobacteraceae bacterium]|nr:alpha/beta hydrolase [Syntrophobacteraceae bacterium]
MIPHLPYAERGQGPTIILVPGLDGTALLFYRQVPILARRFHVLTFPLPDDSTCTMDSLVEDLRQLVEDAVGQKGHERLILCGESFGGALSLSFAVAYPRLLLGLVIVNSFPVIRRRIRLNLAPRLLKLVPWGAMPFVRRFTESRLHSPHTLPVDLAEFHERTRSIGRQGYIRRLEILQQYDIRGQLQRIRTPTLLLAGDLDHLVPSVREARFMASRLPNATVRILKGYGHICLINHDFSLLDHIAPWLENMTG